MRFALMAATALLLACTAELDLQTGRPYPCDGGGCPSGWRCGLEEVCHEAGVAAAYRCEADTHCEAAWRCGLDGTCHDPAVAAAYECEADTDCEGAWRCGLEGVCHDRAVVAAYSCTDDSHCEGGWRCGLEGTCLDAAPDSLRVIAEPALVPQRISPLVFGAAPDQIAANTDVPSAFAFSSGDTLSFLRHDALGLREFDGGQHAVLHTSPLPVGVVPQSMVTTADTTYVLHPGGVHRYQWSASGGGSVYYWGVTGLAVRLSGQALSNPAPPRLIVMRETTFDSANTLTGATTPTQSIRANAPRIRDMIAFNDTTETLLAATDDGLFYAFGNGASIGAWQAVSFPGLPNAACGETMDAGFRVRSFRARDSVVLALEVEPLAPDAGTDSYVVDLSYASGGVSPTCGSMTISSNPLLLGAPFCPACPPGERVVDFGVGRSLDVVTRCAAALADGGTVERAYDFRRGGGCSYDRPYLEGAGQDERVLPPSASAPRDRPIGQGRYGYAHGFAGAHGQLWDSRFSAYEFAGAVTLDRPPRAVAEELDGGVVAVVMAQNGYGQDQALAARSRPGVGLVQSIPDAGELELVGSVQGHPSWSILHRELNPSEYFYVYTLEVRSSPTGAVIARSEEKTVPFEPPFLGATVSSPQGDTYLVVSALDRLLAVRVGSGDVLGVRDVPRPGSPILSLAELPPGPSPYADGGTPVAQGYALTSNGLYRFTAITDLRWRSDEIPIPPGRWREVWTDGARGRLGYGDGTVWSLPSRVRVSEPLPEPVEDYEQVCGQTVALTPSGLHRLRVTSEGGMGTWVPFDVTSELVGPAYGFSGGGLWSTGTDLWLFTRFGEAVRLRSGGCS
ncbi:MAG: hypothetical protein M3Y59_01050 [Myxococcota bacterium]|nr:hypothetical protein [Myxococcota bacterium]